MIMGMKNPANGVESLAASVVRDMEAKARGFCEFCENKPDTLWETLTEYTPHDDRIGTFCQGCECCEKFKWAVDRAYDTALATGLDWREVLSAWEQHRGYWYMNYYQPANQPEIGDPDVFVFDSEDSFVEAVSDKGFTCPMCGHVSQSPYRCEREECGWKSFGFLGCLGEGAYVFIKSEMRGETIFMPVALAGDAS